jgi:uncharacterized alkaline shock family protein YloU
MTQASKRKGAHNAAGGTGAPQDPDLDISQDVLFGIAQLATEGVAGLTSAAPPARMGELLTGRRAKGVVITRGDEGLTIDLHVRVRYGLAIPKVAAEVQRAVREAVASMTGMTVRSVNVTVDAVDLPEDEEAARV